jgi:Galactose oxidase, central domain
MKTNLVLSWAAYVSMTLAQSPGTFTLTGTMTTARVGHTATLLLNGKVLIAGGGRGLGGGSAELYDPSTGAFTTTGEMKTPRSGHTATLLPDGRVLIAGDRDIGSKELASVELYDPASGTFALTGESILLCLSGATLLSNGKVLITGGLRCPFGQFVQPFNLAELYDSATGTFTPTGDMTWGHVANGAALLPDGNVLIAESKSDWWDVGPVVHVGGAESYDPATGTFTPRGDMISGVIWAHSTSLLNGKVLFAGGDDSNTSSGYATAQLYDPPTRTFSATGNMSTGRFDHTQTLLPDGTVLIAGSQRSGSDGGAAVASAELYDQPTVSLFPQEA